MNGRFSQSFVRLQPGPYVTGAAAGLVAKGMSLIAGVGNLWLLTQILTKEEFAGYVFVFALLTWLAMIGTAGLDRTILYRLSRLEAAPGTLVGGSSVAAALAIVLPVSAVLAVVVALVTASADLAHLATVPFWFAVLAPVVVTTCLGRIFEAWFWARSRIAPSLFVPAIGDIARTLCLASAFLVLPTKTGVAVAVIVGALVPLIVWLGIAPLGALRRPSWFEREDVEYGVKAMLAKATNEGGHQLDVIMIGILAAAAATADYAVAARLAATVGVLKNLLATVLTPRLGRYSASGLRNALLREFNQVRLVGLASALAAASILAAFGRPVLHLFGEYEQSYPILMILIAGYVASAGFGSNAAFLTVAGHAGWTLAARAALLVALGVLNLILIPLMGSMGAALSMAIGVAGVNMLLAVIIWRLDRLPTMTTGLLILLAAAYGLLLLCGFGAVSGPLTALGLGALAAGLLAAEWPLWLPALRQLFGVDAQVRPIK